jgi:hypothetical protein
MRLTAALALCIILAPPAHPRAFPAPPPTLQTHGEFREVGAGVEHLRLARGAGAERWTINVLRLDLSKVDVVVARALDAGVGVETTSSIAARHGALAAVNGGYFRTAAGVYRGESVGVLARAGKLLSEPNRGRAALGILKSGAGTEVVFGHLEFKGLVRSASGASHEVGGVNRPRGENELLVYTPEFHRTTLTTPGGVEAIVRRGRVVHISADRGSSLIPPDGFVLSAAGRAAVWLRRRLARGSRVSLSLDLRADANRRAWARAAYVVGGGPRLIRDGRVEITAAREGVTTDFVNTRHPRTAVARDRAGRLLLLTVDGRQPELSVGMSLDELARLLMEFDAVEAINLDGGGSTTMVVGGRVVNSPSDKEGERPVSDALLIMPRRGR